MLKRNQLILLQKSGEFYIVHRYTSTCIRYCVPMPHREALLRLALNLEVEYGNFKKDSHYDRDNARR